MPYTVDGMITGQDNISALFKGVDPTAEGDDQEQEEENVEKNKSTQQEEKQEESITEENSIADIFGNGGSSEKVGNNEDNDEGDERASSKGKKGDSSPEKLYSSYARTLAEEGALSNLSEEDLNQVKDVESLVEAMKKQVNSMLDETQQRVNDALNAGLEGSQVKYYEDTIKSLEEITEDQLNEEGEKGEKLRKALIYNYQKSLGLSDDRANKMTERAFSNATDLEDAKEYLELLKTHFKEEYQNLINQGKEQQKQLKKKQEEEVNKLKDRLLNDKNLLEGVEIDAKTRQDAFNNLMKPTFKNEQGVYQSAMQKYIAEHPLEFQMYSTLFYTMTDGYKNIGKIFGQQVKKEKKKAMRDLEDIINNSQRTPSGAINFNAHDDDSSFNGLELAPVSMWKK